MKSLNIKIGQTFNRLTIIDKPFSKKDKQGNERRFVTCKCVCGRIKSYRLSKITTGHTKSCGCLAKEIIGAINRKHMLSKQRIHTIWTGMKQRCLNPKSNVYKYYGARGIKICDRWLDFKNFSEDMSPTYQERLSLDRINNDGNYCKENCRWADRRTQALNSSRSKKYLVYGEELSMTEICEKFKINPSTLRNRIYRGKLSIIEAIEKPII